MGTSQIETGFNLMPWCQWQHSATQLHTAKRGIAQHSTAQLAYHIIARHCLAQLCTAHQLPIITAGMCRVFLVSISFNLMQINVGPALSTCATAA